VAFVVWATWAYARRPVQAPGPIPALEAP